MPAVKSSPYYRPSPDRINPFCRICPPIARASKLPCLGDDPATGNMSLFTVSDLIEPINVKYLLYPLFSINDAAVRSRAGAKAEGLSLARASGGDIDVDLALAP